MHCQNAPGPFFIVREHRILIFVKRAAGYPSQARGLCRRRRLAGGEESFGIHHPRKHLGQRVGIYQQQTFPFGRSFHCVHHPCTNVP